MTQHSQRVRQTALCHGRRAALPTDCSRDNCRSTGTHCSNGPQRIHLLLALLSAIVLTFFQSGETRAQSRHISHRKLELPQNGTSDVQRQMQLLQQLQALINNKEDSPRESAPPTISPEQLKRLSDLMQQFGGKIPEGMMPDPKDLPPGLLSDVMSDPESKQQIKDLLERYSRDRRIPPANSSSGPSVLPPSPSSNNRTPDPWQPRPTEPNNNATNRSSGDSKAGRSPGNHAPERSGAASNASESGLPSLDALRQKLRNFERKYSDQPGKDDFRKAAPEGGRAATPFGESPRNSGLDTGRQKPTAPTAPRREPRNDAEWAALLEDLIAKQRGEQPASDRSNEAAGANNRASGSGDSMPSLRHFPTPGKSSESSRGLGDTDLSNLDVESVSDFLQKFKDVPSNALPPPAVMPQLDTSRKSENVAPEQTTAAELQKKQQQAKRELSRNGLQQTLKNIVRDARQQAKSANSNTSGGSATSSGLRDSLMRSLGGMSEKILEVAKDAKFKKPTQSTTNRNGGNGRSPNGSTSSTGSGGASTVSQFGKSASNFISNMAASPQAAASPASPAASPNSAESGSSTAFFVLLLLAVAVIGLIVTRRFRSTQAAAGYVGPQIAPADVQSKADVITAFHQMALKPPQNTEAWWTHRKVVDDMGTKQPEKLHPAEVLGQLYEEARYLPDDEDFSVEQILQARAALKRCER